MHKPSSLLAVDLLGIHDPDDIYIYIYTHNHKHINTWERSSDDKM